MPSQAGARRRGRYAEAGRDLALTQPAGLGLQFFAHWRMGNRRHANTRTLVRLPAQGSQLTADLFLRTPAGAARARGGLVYTALMPAFICAACGTQYPPSE